MIRIVANVSKKVPIPELDFSSQSYMAGLEVEVSEGATESQIQSRIGQVYRLLEQSIDAQIAATRSAPNAQPEGVRHPGNNDGNGHEPAPQTRPRFSSSGGNGGNGATATQAQIRAIQAISKANGLGLDVLTVLLQGRYGCQKPERLSVREASNLIEHLKTLKRPA
jgi:hypothetical protein